MDIEEIVEIYEDSLNNRLSSLHQASSEATVYEKRQKYSHSEFGRKNSTMYAMYKCTKLASLVMFQNENFFSNFEPLWSEAMARRQ